MADLTHFDAEGNAIMVDVTAKPETERVATAAGSVYMRPETLSRVREGTIAKGDVLAVARLAGIMAAKKKPLENVDLAELPERTELATLELPPPRAAMQPIEATAEGMRTLLTALRNEKKVL